MERQPLLRGLSLTLARPWLWWIPALVDFAKWGLALALAGTGLWWVEGDFGVPYPIALGGHNLHISLPASLPSTTNLGAQIAPSATAGGGWLQWGLLVAMLALGVILRGGYLNLLNGRAHDVAPSWAAFGRGIRRFSLRLGLLTLVWLGLAAGVLYLVQGRWGPVPIAAIFLALAAWFDLAQFAMVTDDVGPIRGLLGVPLLMGQQGPFATGVLALSVLVTGGLSWGMSLLHLTHPLWGVLPQAILGTWLATAMLCALQVEINVKADPTGRSAWPCPECHTQNRHKAPTCVTCGTPRRIPQPASATTEQ